MDNENSKVISDNKEDSVNPIVVPSEPIEKEMYLLHKTDHGLGNRLLGLSMALAYGKITNRKVIVDWGDSMYSQRTAQKIGRVNSFNRVFWNKNTICGFSKLKPYFSIKPKAWKGHLRSNVFILAKSAGISESPGWKGNNFWNNRLITINYGKFNYTERVLVYYSIYATKGTFLMYRKLLGGKYAQMPYLEFIKSMLEENIGPKKVVTQRVEEFAKENFYGREVISVHLRHTDNRIFLNPVDPKKIFKKLAEVKELHPNAKIFFATDNIKMLEECKNIYGTDVIFTNKYFHSDPNKGLHIDREDKENSLIEALTDLYLLKRTKYLIYSGKSSFGLVAAALSTAKKENIFDADPPEDWPEQSKAIAP